MSDKKVEVLEMAKSFSTIISTLAKNIQNGLGGFEKSSGFKNFFKDIYRDRKNKIHFKRSYTKEGENGKEKFRKKG
ncbi:hypothetical protein LDK30_01610 [Fusobacterium polymorphum]|uniref:Uncharacterized protein n=1 Tax=Fusobacterium nucleatum subsp. polymorphum TaxID=76857 RepID=A0A2C6C2S1_FUSNP|nr:hypothetical protein [Fusobacterium polymorphum]PHI13076.1 hypothetical protein CBG59_04725 [Fusobacterium polymorphum]